MLLEFKLSIILLKIDRWLLNHIFNRSRIFTIALYDCVDEFGNSFGKNGNHFFIRALKNQDDFNSMSSYLIDYYERPKDFETYNYISYAKVDVIGMEKR